MATPHVNRLYGVGKAHIAFSLHLQEQFPHCIAINGPPSPVVKEWCVDQFGPSSTTFSFPSATEIEWTCDPEALWDYFLPHEWKTWFHFRRFEDAMLFKLRWG